MDGLARGLAGALRGFREGRMERDQWNTQVAQQEQLLRRQQEQDARNAALLQAQIAQMQEASRRANEELALRQQDRRMQLRNEGYQEVGSPGEALARFTGANVEQLPTETVGGVQMRRSGRSQAQMTQDRAARDAWAARMDEAKERDQLVAQLPPNVRARAKGLPVASVRALTQQLLARDLMPKETAPVNLQVLDTDQGKMTFDPRSGATRPLMGDGGQPLRRARGGADAVEDRKFQASELAVQQIVPMLQEYKRAIQTTGPQLMAGDDPSVNAMTSLARQIQLAYKGPDFAQLGVLTGPDLDILEDVIASPTGPKAWWRGKDAIAAQIDQVLGNIERGRALRYRLTGREADYQPLVQTGDRKAELQALKTPGR